MKILYLEAYKNVTQYFFWEQHSQFAATLQNITTVNNDTQL